MRSAAALALTAIAALALLTACAGDGGDGDDLDLAGVDAAALLRAAAERTERARSFHFVLEHEGGATEIVRALKMERAEGDVAGADRLRVEVRATAGPLNLDIGIVIIGDDAWITNPLTGRWEREEISIADVFDPATGVTALMRAATDPRVTATERVGGVRTYRVEAAVDSGDVTLFGEPPPRARAHGEGVDRRRGAADLPCGDHRRHHRGRERRSGAAGDVEWLRYGYRDCAAALSRPPRRTRAIARPRPGSRDGGGCCWPRSPGGCSWRPTTRPRW